MTKERCKEIALMIWEDLAKTGSYLEDDANFRLLYEKKITPQECCQIAECVGNVFCTYLAEHLEDTDCSYCPLCNFNADGCGKTNKLPFDLRKSCDDEEQLKIYAQQILEIIQNWTF